MREWLLMSILGIVDVIFCGQGLVTIDYIWL